MCYRIVFALFYFVFGDNFQVLAPKVIFEGAIKRNFFFLRYKFRGHIFGNAYAWRGLFSEFYLICNKMFENKKSLTIVKSDFFFVTQKSVHFKAEIGMC